MTDRCLAREYNVTPETGLALVEVPGTTTLSLPPGTYRVHHALYTANCTTEYQVNGKYE